MKLMAIGFPKSGTTSLTRALETSGLKAAHWQDDKFRFVGQLIYHAVLNELDRSRTWMDMMRSRRPTYVCR